jgi:predicted amidophosphoribosyltransferase
MANINPMRIPGRWREGFVLDYHTLTSVYTGDDEFGRPTFETTRTEVGELLYRLKYRSDLTVVEELVSTLAQFVASWKPGAELIVPVPPSRSARPQQPVLILAEALGLRLGIPGRTDCVKRVKEMPELKDVFQYDERLRLLSGAYAVEGPLVAGRRILLFDDLYRSGATMNAIAAALYDEGHAADVYGLAITRTRSNR